MVKQEKFLSLYKEYERLYRAAGKDVKEDEDETREGSRLRMCRLTRNYLSHVDDAGFLSISDKMMKFLQSRVDRIKSEGDVVKKHLKKPDTCMLNEDTRCSDAIEMYKKLKHENMVIVCNDGTYGLISVYEMLGNKDQNAGTLKRTKIKPQFCCPLDSYSSLDADAVVLCTDDGTSSGKLLGQVWFQ